MVRVIAPVLIVGTLAEDSLMQAHELDLIHAQGASRTTRMQQSTQQMEEQYKAMLANVVSSKSWDDPKTGNPWVPDKALVLDPVEQVIGEMQDELLGQKDLNTWIMGNHTEAISTCNSVRDTALAGEVTDLKNAMVAARGAHKTCREAEDDAIETMELVCEKFDKLDKCNHEQNWFAAIAEGSTGHGTLQEAVDTAVSCKKKIAATSAKASECDGAQDAFQSAFCDYADKLTDTCTNHESCYETNTGNWDQAQGTIDKLEKEQKIIYRMLGRIKCYLQLLFRKADGGATPVQGDIEACQDATVTDDPLDVSYGAKADEGKCYDAAAVIDESVTNRPGGAGAAWYNKEFSKFTAHNKLTADAACA